MKAAIFRGPGDIEVGERPDPAILEPTDVVVTVLRSANELQYFVQVAPSKDMPRYQQTFQNIMSSVRLK